MTVRAIPGFGLSIGIALLWVSLIVLVPLLALAVKPWELGVAGVLRSLAEERVLASLALSFGTAALAGLASLPIGLLLAYAIVRLRFPGRRILDGMVDLPFALPTAVAGIALTALFAPNGWLGAPLAAAFGWKIAFTPAGIVVALVFVALPFIVRTVEPVLRDLGRDAEEAAATLGATRPQALARVVLPALAPALVSGFGLGFARGRGIWQRHLHCRQHADGERDRAAADRHPAGAVRLCRRGRGGARHAVAVLRRAAGAVRAATPAAAGSRVSARIYLA